MNNFDKTLMLLKEGTIKNPKCPSCKKELYRGKNMTSYMCNNEDCPKYEFMFKDKDVLKEDNEIKTITIEKDSSTGEYRVPAPDGYENGATYTDDMQDAIDTAKSIYGKDVIIKFRSVREFVGGKYELYRPVNEAKTLQDLKQRAQRAIDNEESFVFDICADSGQIFDNVKNMRWFKQEVCQYLIDNVKSFNKLVLESNWSSDVSTKWKPPKELFTKSATKIVSGLISGHDGNIGKAIKSLNFYINRCGSKCENIEALETAKERLHKKLEKQKVKK